MSVEPRLELLIDGLGANGDGVGRLSDGRVVFVARALPGDRVRVRLAETKKKVQYAELIEVLAPSPDRVESRCKIPACGGCALRGLSLDSQGSLKRSRIVETLRRLGGLDVSELLQTVEEAGDGWRSRHRVRLHAAWTGRRYKLGFHERHSNNLVALSSCPVMWTELEQASFALAQIIESLPQQAQLLEAEVVYSRRDGRAAVKLTGDGPIDTYKTWLGDNQPGFGVDIVTPGFNWRHGNLELRYDHRRASEFDLRFEPGVFTQAHPEMNDRLVDAVLAILRPSQNPRVLELHAGIGNFSIPLSLAGASLIATERHKRATILCQRNARGAGVDLEVHDLSDEDAVRDLSRIDTVLLDPPRIGAREACQQIAASKFVQRVVYVSCDVATLARDAASLVQGGFRLVTARGFDMFPQTPHVETILAFER